MIEIIGHALSQWDVGRSVQITGIEADHAHFANKGDSKAVIMDVVDTKAKIPDYLLQTGKQLCVYAAKDGITVESKTFYVQKRERPENYVYEDDQRNYIYELITSAEKAIEAANQAAEAASPAADSANAAAEDANNAASIASEAAKNANEAAAKAAHTAKSLMVVGEAGGVNIHLDDAIDQFLVGMRIFGKTTQDGTPTPDAPVDLVSIGSSGSITVSVTGEDVKSMTIATPNGLPGIPVAEGGNYTDASGQKWVCDEIDFGRGVYVRRCGELVIDGSGYVNVGQHANGQHYCTQEAPGVIVLEGSAPRMVLADRYEASGWTNKNNKAYCIGRTMVLTDNRFIDQSTTIAILQAEKPKCMYVLEPPIETQLSAEELAAFSALHTYRGNTVVSNDAGAYMDLEYVMDAKKYIDSLITGGVVPATVE